MLAPSVCLYPTGSLDTDAMGNNPSWEAAAFGLGKTSKDSKEKQNYEVHVLGEKGRKSTLLHTAVKHKQRKSLRSELPWC